MHRRVASDATSPDSEICSDNFIAMFSTVLPLSVWQLIATALLIYIGSTIASGLYNLYFHPLAKFPGPRWAAFSTWWKTNLEVVQGLNLSEELFKLHEIHGDVIRIGPNELHFSNPSVYHEIYNPAVRWSRDPSLYRVFSKHESLLTMMEYSKAKKRKDILRPLFSHQSMLKLQHLIQECADKMCANIERHAQENRPVNFFRAYRCFTLDGITSYCFAASMDTVSAPHFEMTAEMALDEASTVFPFLKHFILLKYLVRSIPEGLASRMNPSMAGAARMFKMLRDQVERVLAHPEVLNSASHPTIFHELVSGEKGREVPSQPELEDEALLMVAAGTDTSSNVLSLATVHILSNPDIHAKLKDELIKAWPDLHDAPRYEDLENLPYLKAVLKESLRLSHGVYTPMTRIVPDAGAQINGVNVPGGTIVGISNLFVHLNPTIFPEPHSFKPDRWLEKSENGSLDNWLVAFSKGPRSCLGINLGWCEMTVVLANLLRRFELELVDGIKPTDLAWHECYVPHYCGPALKMRATPRSS